MKTPLNFFAHRKDRANLPSPLNFVTELSMQRLGQSFVKMLDALDDRFFELAEGAGTAIEQNFYFEAMREVRIGRRDIERVFTQKIENAFHVMCWGCIEEDVPEPSDIDNESLIELQEFKTRMLSRFKTKSAVELYKLTLRLDAISDDFFVSDKNNPLTYAGVYGCFDTAISVLGLDSKAKLVVVKLFDHFVINELSELLIETNILLASHGILPEVISVSSESKQTLVSANEEKYAQPPALQSQGVFPHLQQLMTSGAIATKTDDEQKTGALLSKNELLSILSSLQRKVLVLSKKHEEHLLLDVRGQILMVLNERQDQYVGSLLSAADEDVLQLVAMLMNAFLADRYLPDQVKTSICHLQIPLIKVGIMDHTLFGERDHVARHFINELARVGVDNHGKSVLVREVIYSKIEEVVQRILLDFGDDVSIFERELNDLQFYYKRALSHADHLENRAQLAETGREKAELGRRVVQQNLAMLSSDKYIPPVVQKILEECWSNLLLITLLQEGVESAAWQDHMLTAETLVSSVQPGKDAVSRRRFLNLVPALLVKIREGLKKNQTDAYAISLILTDLEQAHLTALSTDGARTEPRVPNSIQNKNTEFSTTSSVRQQAPVIGDVATITREIVHKSSRDEGVATDIPPSKETSDQKAEKSEAESFHKDTALLDPVQVEQWVDQLNLGVWFEVKNTETNSKYRCKLAAHLPAFNKYIFVNRRGVKVMERGR
ncbi:MAG TPA: DUF1631 family protein, partial [Pseudomonadales bacterium]|nr:DUF1631 family protein [Pseudomonadales bacterium]